MKNISYLCEGRGLWDSNAWKEIVVVIVADGREKINNNVLNVLGFQGLYLHGMEKTSVNGKDVHAHLFEFTTQVNVNEFLKREKSKKSRIFPCQTVFLLKEKNKKKINSHRWFFNALCKV